MTSFPCVLLARFWILETFSFVTDVLRRDSLLFSAFFLILCENVKTLIILVVSSTPYSFLLPQDAWHSQGMSHQTVSCTVIHDHVLRYHTVQLNVGCVCGWVCSHGDSALEILHIVCATIVRVDLPYLLKSLSWGHLHLMYEVKVYLEAFLDIVTEALCFLTSVPDYTSWTWKWRAVEKTQELVKFLLTLSFLLLNPDTGEALSYSHCHQEKDSLSAPEHDEDYTVKSNIRKCVVVGHYLIGTGMSTCNLIHLYS